MVYRRVFVGYLMLLTRQAICQEIKEVSVCYDDVNICLWTNGSTLTQSDAERACQQRMNSFLPRIPNSHIQNKMQQFRTEAVKLLSGFRGQGFWIDVTAVDVNDFHWIDGASLQGLLLFTTKHVNTYMNVDLYSALR